jgi:hypothetical protein
MRSVRGLGGGLTRRAFTGSKIPLIVGYWGCLEHQAKFVQELASRKELTEVTSRDVKKLGGTGLIKYFGSFNALKERLFRPSTLSQKGEPFTTSQSRQYLLDRAGELGIRDADDPKSWFELSTVDFLRLERGHELLGQFESKEALITGLLGHSLPLDHKKRLPSAYWDSVLHQR